MYDIVKGKPVDAIILLMYLQCALMQCIQKSCQYTDSWYCFTWSNYVFY